MAKKRSKGENRSAAIRELLAKSPDMPVKEVAAQVGVSPNLVYFIKSKSKARARRAKREKAVAAGKAAGLSDPIELIVGVRRLAEQAGGIKKLKQLVDVLAE